jgi:hypothetical protein
LTKTMTIVALICFLVVGTAATAILGRDSVPAAPPNWRRRSAVRRRFRTGKQEGPAGRRELRTAAYLMPQTTAAERARCAGPTTSTAPADIGLPKEVCAPAAHRPCCRSPRLSPPQPQKNYALLSDVQIAGIKDRLKLSSSRRILLAARGNRAARRRPQDPCGRQANPTASACRSIPRLQKSSS